MKTMLSNLANALEAVYAGLNSAKADVVYTTLNALFEDQAGATPENVAVLFQNDCLTYGQLRRLSNQIAHYLTDHGTGPGDFVGVNAERRPYTIAALLGVLKAGAAYVPIDPDYPQSRREYIMEHSGCTLFLDGSSEESYRISGYSHDKVDVAVHPEMPAYAIYTSGSTGLPKGVVIPHVGAVNTILDVNQRLNVSAEDNIIGISSMCFDLSVYDIFGALCSGATLVQVADHRDLQGLYNTIVQNKITVWNSVPAILNLLIRHVEIENPVTSMRAILLSGDWIPMDLPEKAHTHFPNASVFSLGGATEASIWSIMYEIGEVSSQWKSIPYGYPMTNQTFYVLNYNNDLCPVGVQGELCIGGVGVAAGYLNDQEKTDQAFIFDDRYGRIYKTGDYGLVHKDGYIEFLGRKDSQVKINGYRVELGEIETCLNADNSVAESVVINRKNDMDEDYLCAFIVTHGEKKESEHYRGVISAALPAYMIPKSFVFVDSIPLTANGKVDRKTLLAMETPMEAAAVEYVPPKTDIERELAEIMEHTLNNGSKVGLTSNFFDIGVNSIMMVQIINTIAEKMGVQIGFRDFIKLNNLAEFAQFIEGADPTTAVSIATAKTDVENLHKAFDLTEVQTAYLMGRDNVFEMGGTSTHAYIELETELDIARLNEALVKVIDRHPAMRMVILPTGQQQILRHTEPYQIEVRDMRGVSPDIVQEEILKYRQEMSHHVFDPGKWPLFDFRAFRLSDNKSYMFVGYDLLVMDGMSTRIFSRELLDHYNNPLLQLPSLEYTFRDYMIQAKEFKSSEAYHADRNFWLGRLGDFATAPALPYKMDPALVTTPEFRRLQRVIPRNDWDKIKGFAKKYKVTPSALLCTAFAKVLSRYSNQERLAINLTVFNRYPFHEDVNRIIGDFTSAMLIDYNPQQPADDFWGCAQDTQNIIMEALEHRHFDGVECIRELNRRNATSTKATMPIVFTSMIFEQWDEVRDDGGQLGEIVNSVSQTSQVFLDHQATDENGDLKLTWDYVTAIFDVAMIEDMFRLYCDVFQSILTEQTQVTFQLPQAQEAAVSAYNNTSTAIVSKNILDLFEANVTDLADKTAVSYKGESMTYRQLDEAATRIANYIRGEGVEKGDYVGLIAHRRPKTIACILGILKVGAAYVPIDSTIPEERKAYILQHSHCDLCLDSAELPDLKDYNCTCRSEKLALDDVAYVIYTSGSTGKPKGVVITHGAAVNTILDILDRFSISRRDVLMGISSLCFDLSVFDVFGSLAAGASLVQIDDPRDVEDLAQTVISEGVTVWNSVPAIMNVVLQNCRWLQSAALRTVMLSGDWIPLTLPAKINAAFPNAKTYSLGGATEAAIWSIYYPIEGVDKTWNSIPYGYPLANQSIYILNQQGQLAPVGVKGAIYIGGLGLAEGYLNDQEKTQAAFVVHPALGRLYKTGDIGVFRKEGYVEFLGREDDQVKINGYRVELGEIENAMLSHPQVDNSVVTFTQMETGKMVLCAYYLSHTGMELELKPHLSSLLPSYMVPELLIMVAEFPLTANGKIDRKKLPAPTIKQMASKEFIAPSTSEEITLAGIWGSVLQIDHIGVNENFFELGGDSIKAITIVAQANAKGIHITIKDIFGGLTIQNILSASRAQTHVDAPQDEITGEWKLSPVQMDFFEQGYELPGFWNMNFTFRLPSDTDPQRLKAAIDKVVAHHDALRARFEFDGKSGVKQIVVPSSLVDYEFVQHTVSCDGINADMIEVCRDIQRRRSIDRPLLAFAFFKSGGENSDVHLFASIHHLAVDGVSWRILMDDIETAYHGNKLPTKTSPFSYWGDALQEHAASSSLDINYWQSIPAIKNQLSDAAADPLSWRYCQCENLGISLPEEMTPLLIKQANAAYGTKVDELILGALLYAYEVTFSSQELLMMRESHGRSESFDGINVSRTVGWFTSEYPVYLQSQKDMRSTIQHIKTTLRAIENEGIDYGVDRYINGNKVLSAINPEIGFNYLGQFTVPSKSMLQPVIDNRIDMIGGENLYRYVLYLSGYETDGVISFNLTYNRSFVSDEEAQLFMQHFRKNLSDIGRHCVQEIERQEQLFASVQPDAEHRNEPFPLTGVQMAYLAGRGESFELGGTSTHMFQEVETSIDLEQYEAVLNKLIAHHPMLRCIVLEDGTQQVMESVPYYCIDITDLSTLNDEEREQELELRRQEMSHEIFEAGTWPMFRFNAYQIGENLYRLFIGFDLIIADGGSIMMLNQQMVDLCNHPETELVPQSFSFRDYVVAWNKLKTTQRYQDDKNFWLSQMEKFAPAPELPLSRDPLTVKTPHFNRLAKIFNQIQWRRFKRRAQKDNITASALLATMYSDTLSHWSNQERLTLNMTVFNRYPFNEEVENIIGDFSSIILVNADCKDPSFVQRAKGVQNTILDALDHRLYDGVELIREITQKRNMGNKALAPVVFTSMLFNRSDDTQSIRDGLGELKTSVSQTSQVYIDFQALDTDNVLSVTWDYVKEIFDLYVIDEMFAEFTAMIQSYIDGADPRPALSESVQELMRQYNSTEDDIPPMLLHEMVGESIKQHPNNLAIALGDERITYRQLDQNAWNVAGYLKTQGVKPGDKVSVESIRKPLTIVTILGILRAGAAYVPVDHALPRERHDFIVRQSGSVLFLTADAMAAAAQFSGPLSNICTPVAPDSAAYIIFTSGSTGKPKGVVISHRAASNTILDINKRYQVSAEDRIIGLSSMCFDLSVYDIFGSLAAGAALIMVEDQRDTKNILEIVDQEKITIWNSVPAIMEMTTTYLEHQSNRADEIDSDLPYYWSPTAHWEIRERGLYISGKEYSSLPAAIMPEFYFRLQRGVRLEDLIAMHREFKMEPDTYRKVVGNLIDNKVLINSLLLPEEVFASQEKLFHSQYGDELIFDEKAYNRFKQQQLQRETYPNNDTTVALADIPYPYDFQTRRSYRTFNESSTVPHAVLSQYLSVLKQYVSDGKKHYNYASAGGFYPIDVYVYIKKDRAEGFQEGLYYYNSIQNSMTLVNKEDRITTDAYYYTNKNIFTASAFTLYFVYNAAVSMPRYSYNGYYYACIDLGIMIGTLTQAAEQLNLGMCSIGDLNYDGISQCLRLPHNHMYLHAVEVGLKPEATPVPFVDKVMALDSEHRVAAVPESGNLRLVMLSGDWIPLRLPRKIKEHFQKAKTVSLGGATEASIWSIYYPVDEIQPGWVSIPYGMPLSNQYIYILDTALQPCPPEVRGDIFIGGVGIADGYVGDQEKTDQVFIQHPEFGRVYRTGDKGVLHRVGYVEFLGRDDDQVKIGGYRIELGEIESCIAEYSGVDRAVTTVIRDTTGNGRIAAYYTGKPVDHTSLRNSLAGKLPQYMIPHYFANLLTLPLTSNGKVDKNALPASKMETVEITMVPPTNDVEARLVDIWKDILQIGSVGITDNFFEVGGYSVQVAQLVATLENEFKVNIPVRQLFYNPTIEAVAQCIAEQLGEKKTPNGTTDGNLLMLREGITDQNIFFVHGGVGESIVFIDWCKRINPEYNCWGLSTTKKNALPGPQSQDMKSLVQSYIAQIKTVQQNGPYNLAGWSAGGVIAYAIAGQLEANGESVGRLLLIDSMQPGSYDLDQTGFTHEYQVQKELKEIACYLDNDMLISSLGKATSTNELWAAFCGILESDQGIYDDFKAAVAQRMPFIANSIPHLDQVAPATLIQYINNFRSFVNTLIGYKPQTSVTANTTLFLCKDSTVRIEVNAWKQNLRSLGVVTVEGDHFSVLYTPAVDSLAQATNEAFA